jgi:hypothetical protein
MGFVRARLSLAMLRATALCIRGSRKSVAGIRFALDDGAGMCLHFWNRAEIGPELNEMFLSVCLFLGWIQSRTINGVHSCVCALRRKKIKYIYIYMLRKKYRGMHIKWNYYNTKLQLARLISLNIYPYFSFLPQIFVETLNLLFLKYTLTALFDRGLRPSINQSHSRSLQCLSYCSLHGVC